MNMTLSIFLVTAATAAARTRTRRSRATPSVPNNDSTHQQVKADE